MAQGQTNLKNLDSTRDGDMMDDPLMHQYLEQQGMTQAEYRAILSMLNTAIEYISDEQKGLSERFVDLGSEVVLKMRYADGNTEAITVTLGSALDARFLGKQQSLFDNDVTFLISTDTPLGMAIKGARIGEKVAYSSNGEVNEAKVISIKPSPLI